MTPTYRQIWLAYHTRKAGAAQLALATETNPVRRVELAHELTRHTAAVNRLDREAQASDRQKVSTT